MIEYQCQPRFQKNLRPSNCANQWDHYLVRSFDQCWKIGTATAPIQQLWFPIKLSNNRKRFFTNDKDGDCSEFCECLKLTDCRLGFCDLLHYLHESIVDPEKMQSWTTYLLFKDPMKGFISTGGQSMIFMVRNPASIASVNQIPSNILLVRKAWNETRSIPKFDYLAMECEQDCMKALIRVCFTSPAGGHPSLKRWVTYYSV